MTARRLMLAAIALAVLLDFATNWLSNRAIDH